MFEVLRFGFKLIVIYLMLYIPMLLKKYINIRRVRIEFCHIIKKYIELQIEFTHLMNVVAVKNIYTFIWSYQSRINVNASLI